MRLSNRRPSRRGAATLEAAIVVPVFLLLVLGTIDIGLAVSRQSSLSQAARQGARKAAVHGKLAPAGWDGGPWGVDTIEEPIAVSGNYAVDAVKPMLVNCPVDQTYVRFEWPEGRNDVGNQVRVTVTSEYTPMMTFIFGAPTITLRATSTMMISH
jgi:Flp pilus assembly protein TadG